jgi:hypothetical protein
MDVDDSLDLSNFAKVSGAILDYIDKYTIAKVSGAILAFYGTVLFLAPQKVHDLYGTKDVVLKLEDPKGPMVIEYLVRRGALIMLTLPAMWYLHVEAGLSREKAAGVCILPMILFCLHSLLNEIPKQMGSSNRVDVSSLMIYIPVACVTLSGATYSDFALKSLWGWALANGLLCYMTPSAIDTVYDTPQREEFVLLQRSMFGAHLINVSLFGGAFAMGMDDAKSVGIAWASAFVTTLWKMKDFQKFNVSTGPVYIWLASMAFFAITLLL